MGEVAKLVAGLVGVLVGLVAGFGALTLVMQRTGGALFDTPLLGVIVSAGLLGGGAAIVGYLTLWIAGAISKRRKDSRREANRRSKKLR